MNDRMRVALEAFGVLLVAVYFAQHITLPPDFAEGAALITYADRLARGERIYFDLLEYYGPPAWKLLTLAYVLAGKKVIGIHVYMAIVKTASTVAVYSVVRRLADRVYGALAALFVAVLLGQPYPFFNIAYAAHTAFAPMVAAWGLLLLAPAGRERSFAALAGVVTAAVLWVKVSTGAFLLAGGLLVLACAKPGRLGVLPPKVWLALQFLLLFGCAAVFHLYASTVYRWQYVFYLSAPLLLVLVSLASAVLRAKGEGRVVGDFPAVAIYLGTTLLAWGSYLLFYFGPEHALPYLSEQAATFVRLEYVAPFPEIGRRGHFGRFNSAYWPLLPWLATALYAGWCIIARRLRARGDDSVDERDMRLTGLFALLAVHGFVIHARCDEPHLFYAILAGAPGAMVAAHHVVGALPRLGAPLPQLALLGLAAGCVLFASTLVVVPSVDDYALNRGDWTSPRFEHLRYYPKDYPFARALDRKLAQFDPTVDKATRTLDQMTTDGEEVLVLSHTQILALGGHVEPAGGRYVHLLWLLRYNVVPSAAFRELVPGAFVRAFTSNPARVIVEERGNHMLVDQLPELRETMAKHYRVEREDDLFRYHVRVEGEPKSSL